MPQTYRPLVLVAEEKLHKLHINYSELKIMYILSPLSLVLLIPLLLSSCHSTPTTLNESDAPLNQLAEARDLHIVMVAYKASQELELYYKSSTDKSFTFYRTYPICRASGELGPKRREGDRQVPEGFYHIDRFNPNSAYHLSLGLDYPNASDRILGHPTEPGSDIFIHGKCVTVGCLPMTDPIIEKLYSYAVAARDSGQERIPVYIFPFRMAEEEMRRHLQAAENERHAAFWRDLKVGYDEWHLHREALTFSIDQAGRYRFE